MLELIIFLYVLQLFTLVMTGFLLLMALKAHLSGAERVEAAKLLLYGAIYAFVSIASGSIALVLIG